MADIKWIKITTDIFDDEKILLIESMPEANAIIVVWFKLLCLAGKQNNSGVFMINDRIPYTDEMLSTIFRMNLNTVRLALNTFERFGMIERIEGVITIPNWGKHQSADKIEKYNEYHKNYQREYRKKQKQKALGVSETADLPDDINGDVNDKVNRKVNVNCVEEEQDYKNIDDKNKDIKESIDICVAAWNLLDAFGVNRISRISPSSTRYKNLKSRIAEYGEGGVLEAIERIKESDFLLGRKTDFVIDFDWFVKPNNFPKVFDGNYSKNRNSKQQQATDRLGWIDGIDYTGV